MKVRVRLFAVAKELAGAEEVLVDVPAMANIGDVREAIEEILPALRRVLPHAMWAIGSAYADDASQVNDKSDVALIPPVSGG
jgi:molybdopterin converting factor small subunit